MAYRDQAEKDRLQTELKDAKASGDQTKIDAAQKKFDTAKACPVDATNPVQ